MASPSTGFPTSLTLCLSLEMILRHINIEPVYFVLFHSFIDKINNKLHGLLPPGGLVSPPGGFASLAFDQAVPKNSQRHLANRNTICILHRSDCAWLCYLLSQYATKISQPHLSSTQLASAKFSERQAHRSQLKFLTQPVPQTVVQLHRIDNSKKPEPVTRHIFGLFEFFSKHATFELSLMSNDENKFLPIFQILHVKNA